MEENIKAYVPKFYLYDENFPCNFDDYIERSKICLEENGKQVHKDIVKEDLIHGKYNGKKGFIVPNKEVIQDKEAPIYYFVREFDNIYTITYAMFFYLNPGYIFNLNVQGHYSDWEHVTLEFDYEHKPLRMYFSCHSSLEGRWWAWKDVQLDINQRPRVYVAPKSNANYHRPGFYPRVLGFANDKTRADGPVWDPTELLLVENEYWINYTGYVGCNLKGTKPSVKNISQQYWFRRDSQKSSNSFVQIFLPFYKLFKR